MKLDDSERGKIEKKEKDAYTKELTRIKVKKAKERAKYDDLSPIRKVLSWFGI